MVAQADRRGEKIHNDVQKWLKDVALIIKDTEEFLKGKCQATGEPNEVVKDEHQAKMKRPHQFCPNPRLRYQLSRKSTKLVEAMVELYKRKDFSIISYVVRPQELCVISDEDSEAFDSRISDADYEAFDSRISTFNKIIDELKSPSADIILVYGIAGVGKTTLVEQVLRQVTKDELFDDAVMVRDVKIPNLEAIQKEIAEKLGVEVLSNQTIYGRASRKCERIKYKKTLVILDDVWAKVDLKILGLPHIPTCKIVLTSRTRKVLSSDKFKQKVFLLGVLDEHETWLLFEKKAGGVTKDPTIRIIATQVAKKCGDLPVLIVTIAKALENSSLPIWKNALRSLDRFDEKEELTEKAYMGLEWSYAQLNEQLKPLFLLCGTTIQGNSISLKNLLKYSMGLGFFRDHTVEEARNALYTQVDKLKSSCLLLDGDDNTCVRMHDLVHHVAIRIATRDHHVLVKDGVDQLKEWPDQDSFKRCSRISWSCCNVPSLPEIPWKCPELEMFRLHGNGEKNDHHSKIPNNFFGEMPELKVLDICNLPLMSLPPSLELLKTNLQTLCLDGCTLEDIALVGELSNLETLSFANSKIKELPKEIAKLTHLRLLDLSDCPELEVISPNVISSLTRLEDLRMKNSFENWEAEGDINERRNANLLELKHLSQLTALKIYIPDVDILPPNLFSNKLERYHIHIGGVWSKCTAETTFNTLKLELTPRNQSDQGLRRLMMRSEDLALDVMELDCESFLHLERLLFQNNVYLSHINDKKVVFSNLTTLSVHGCDRLRFMFSFSMAVMLVQLKQLVISRCELIEEIISSSIECEENMDIMFPNLEDLILVGLPNLARFCTGSCIEFPSLKNLEIVQCSNLGAFIGDNKIWKEIEVRDPEENPDLKSETAVQYFLFDGKAGFPCLERLKINQASKLKTIWHIQLAQDSFCRLTQVEVSECVSLINVLPPSIMGRLNALEVRSCERIEIIVASNTIGNNYPDDVLDNEIAFRRLQRLTLADLPSLQGFCSSGNCIVKFSSSITLTVEFCPIEMMISPEGSLLSHRNGSRILTMKKIMGELKNPDTIRIGVSGIGGVGKTTLVKEVHKQATEDKELFDDVVILLDVKSNTDLEGIQKKIVEKLGMDILDSDTIDGRASRLSARIKDKKILVILDDVWEQIDLVAVGLPSVAACKILLTSRSRKILSDMSTQKEFLLDILQEEESWVLFEEKAGDVVKDPAIQTVAKQVVKNCGGLPILVVTVASALKQRTTLPLWKDALTCLQKGEELREKADLGLQWSYNQLNDKELKPLFLLCGITIRGNSISLADLLRYSMGLGFFEKAFTMEQARKTLLSRIEKLKDCCLLTDSDDNRYVGMHELVLNVANQIAFRDQHILSLVEDRGNRELKEWPDKYFLEKCTIMFLPCGNNIPRLPEIMHCPALTMFHLQGDLDDDSQKISPRFFEKMKNLQVLSLRCMTIPTLPSSLQFLKNLDFLCLDQCILGDVALIGELSNLEILSFSESNVKQLPRAVGQLTHLRMLDLSDCSELEVISPGVISSLGRLEELRMRNSFNKWEVAGKGSNASLSELKNLSQLSSLEIHIPNADILPANLFSHKLERFNIIIGDVWEKFMVETTLNILKLKLTTSIEQLDEGLKFLVERSEDLSLYTETVNNVFHPLHTKEFEYLKHLQLQSNVDDFTYIINRKVVFPNLPILRVHRSDGRSFLFSFSMPKSPVELQSFVELQSLAELKHLEISTYEVEESLLSAREYSQQNVDNMFSKWINLKLNESPDIIRLFSGSIDKLEIEGWIKMKRLCKEIEESHSGEDLDVKMELITVQYILFDLKPVFPNLTSLTVHRCDRRLSFLFSISMAKSLVALKHLEISTCEIIEEIVSSTREHGQENMANMFPKLEDLKLNELPNLTRFCFGSYIRLQYLEKLDIEGCNKLGAFICDNVAMSGENIRICKEIEEKDSEENRDVNSELNTAQCFLFDEKIGLPNLTSLMVHRCDGLNFLLLSSMARSLVKLKHLVISECQRMEAVLTKEHSEENKDNMFPELKELELKDLPHLIRFCSENCFEFASMERLQLEKCAKLETSICNPSSNSIASQKEMERVDRNENLETVVPYFLFDKKVGLPRLEKLIINDLPKLTKIWHTQLAPNSFCTLSDITVQQCNGLKYIFQDSIVAGVFQQLQKLIVKECGVLEEIVSQEEGVEKLVHDQFFPKLACLELRSLFQLKRFYLRMPAITWPLETLVLSDCQKVDIFAERHDSGNQPTAVKQSPVLFEKSPFSKLEVLTFGPVNIWYSRPAHKKALFPAISTDGSLPDLRTLRLRGMERYMRLWENTEPAAASAFPQLETLEVKNSGLTNLELSAISFQNLTTLEVTFCWRLQYLTTYSVAQSLVQLETLKVEECKNMKEIFTSEGMGEDASKCEIVFSQLQSLELSDLISLERFCSSNCSVKVPTLGTLNLKVNWCPLKLKISSDNVLEVDLDVQKAHSSKEALDTTESACSSETNQKRPAPNDNGTRLPGITGSEHGVEAVIDAQNIGQAEVMDLKQKQIVTNTRKNLQESDFGEPLNANEGKQTQFEAKRSELIAGSSQVEAECQEVMGREAELTNIRQQIKVLEARAATLEADMSSGKQRYSPNPP